jgi:hypothetical protein
MMYPLVRELADDGVPVTVTCRVLKLCRQHYYRWLAPPVSPTGSSTRRIGERDLRRARDDPEFGYRFLADEVRDAGHEPVTAPCGGSAAPRTAGGLGSARRGGARSSKPGTRQPTTTWSPEFTAPTPEPAVADRHHRAPHREGKLYLCAIKDVWSPTGSSATRSTTA